MRSFAFNIVALPALLTLAHIAKPGSAVGQEPTEPSASLIEVHHDVREVLFDGDRLRVQVEAVGALDVYVYLICQDAEGDLVLLFPNQAEGHNFIEAGARLNIPQNVRLGFKIRPPFGRERLLILAAPYPLTDLEKLFDEAPSADILGQMLDSLAEQTDLDLRVIEFESRPAGGQDLQSGPELVQ